MSEHDDGAPKPGVETVQLPEQSLEDMTWREMAVDWIKQVVAISQYVDKYAMSYEGGQLWWEAGRQHKARYSEFPTDDESEIERRKQELATTQQEIIDTDPGVIEKNRFLAMLLSQIDGSYQLDTILDELPGVGGEAVRKILEDEAVGRGEEPDEDVVETLVDQATEDAKRVVKESDEISKAFGVLADMQADHTINTLVSLRQYAAKVGDNPMIYLNQFLGLFNIYQAGKAAVEGAEDAE